MGIRATPNHSGILTSRILRWRPESEQMQNDPAKKTRCSEIWLRFIVDIRALLFLALDFEV